MVRVAYWDVEQGAQTPRLIGSVQGTPTLKLFKPKGKKNKKQVIDYQYERKAKDMMKFAARHMPNYVERVSGVDGMQAYEAKADKYGLPKVLVFSDSGTKPVIKAMTTEYRRRLLVGEIRRNRKNTELIQRYKVKKFPTILSVDADGNTVSFTKKWTVNKLKNFLYGVALKKPVKGPRRQQNKKEL